MSSFRCQVCFEDRSARLALPRLATINGDVLRAGDCLHPICQTCTAAFVVARVQEQRVFGLHCPIEGCKNELFEQDVQKLFEKGALNQEVCERFGSLRRQDYTSRLHQVYDDASLMKWLWKAARRCPRCNVIIEKASGCNSFGCICGHRFNFSTAPRGWGDGVSNFDSVLDLAEHHNMSLRDAEGRIKTASTTKGIKIYQRVLRRADKRQLPLEMAEVHAQAVLQQQDAIAQLRDARRIRHDSRKQHMLVTQLGVSAEEAKGLVNQAKDGDKVAWQKLRTARELKAAASTLGVRVQHTLDSACSGTSAERKEPDTEV